MPPIVCRRLFPRLTIYFDDVFTPIAFATRNEPGPSNYDDEDHCTCSAREGLHINILEECDDRGFSTKVQDCSQYTRFVPYILVNVGQVLNGAITHNLGPGPTSDVGIAPQPTTRPSYHQTF